MQTDAFTSAPFAVGKTLPSTTDRHIPANRRVEFLYKCVGRGTRIDGLEEWCSKRGFARVADFTGAMIDEMPAETYASAVAPIG